MITPIAPAQAACATLATCPPSTSSPLPVPPFGSFQGAFASVTAPRLGATAIKGALERAKVAPEQVGEVFMGNVLSAGIGQAPARQAAIYAGVPTRVPATTVSKVCGSGLQAVVLGAKTLALGDAEIVVAGGMESMSNVPYYLTQARTGYRMGDGKLIDGMIFDGLWDPYNNFHMGNAGELCAKEYDLTREPQDEFAQQSYAPALAAQKSGAFADEIAPVSIAQKKGDPILVSEDEEPGRGDPSKFASCARPSRRTARSPPPTPRSINDGAAALVLASESGGEAPRLSSRSRASSATAARRRRPSGSRPRPPSPSTSTLKKLGLATNDIDLCEINEAFAVRRDGLHASSRGIDPAKVNVRGGAVALGHPIGASGARILTTLLHAMHDGTRSAASPRCASAAAKRSRSSSSAAERDARVVSAAKDSAFARALAGHRSNRFKNQRRASVEMPRLTCSQARPAAASSAPHSFCTSCAVHLRKAPILLDFWRPLTGFDQPLLEARLGQDQLARRSRCLARPRARAAPPSSASRLGASRPWP